MAHITVCDNCEKKLMGEMRINGYFRDRYITVITHKCESPQTKNETDIPDKHFCGEMCMRTYYSKLIVATGDDL